MNKQHEAKTSFFVSRKFIANKNEKDTKAKMMMSHFTSKLNKIP